MQQPSIGSNGPSGGGWEGGLDEVLGQRRRVSNTYAPDSRYEASGTPMGGRNLGPAMDGEGLGDVMPARGPPPANIAARFAQGERGGGPDAEEYEPMQQRPGQRQSRPNEGASDWGGASLGDTLLPPPKVGGGKERYGPRGGNVGNEYDDRQGGGNSNAANDYQGRDGGGDYDRQDYDRRGGGGGGDFDRRGDYDRPDDYGGGNGGNDYDRQPDRQDPDYYDNGSRGGFRQPSPDPRFNERLDERPSLFDERPIGKAPSGRPQPNGNSGGFGGGMGGDDEEDFNVMVKVPSRPPPGTRVEINMNDDVPPAKQDSWASEPRRPARKKVAPVDDCWAGQSLGDAFAPPKAGAAPASGGGGGGSSASDFPPRKGEAPKGAPSGGDCQKKPEEIIAWVRTLPESHVPEKAREAIAEIIEEGRLGGRDFTAYVQKIPPEICPPRNAMKLKTAWNNVLAEAAASAVARENACKPPPPKATMIIVA